ncbi:hypothetical protein RND81_02G138200 [Saponaria officinalis]|uniref:Uncharacterized protein n=1 Tax=Saponaria officinalis TaxID=3572 RepID=A0AAW1MQE8_SAPOF
MAMQKCKFFATHCTVLGSPTRCPTSSPIVHIHRRKTLRMLLDNSDASHHASFHRRFLAPQPPNDQKKHGNKVWSKLRDLFVSSLENTVELVSDISDSGVGVVQAG